MRVGRRAPLCPFILLCKYRVCGHPMTRVHWFAGRERVSTVWGLSFIKAVEESCGIGRVLLSLRQELRSFLNLGGCAESFSLMLVFVMTGPRAEGGQPSGEIGSWGFMGEGHRPPTLLKT